MSDYTSWQCGMRVICVDDRDVGGGYAIVNNGEYTISEIRAGEFFCARANEWIHAVGIKVSEIDMLCSEWFEASRFRRAAKRPTSIAIFERIRDNPKAPITSPKQRERVS